MTENKFKLAKANYITERGNERKNLIYLLKSIKNNENDLVIQDYKKSGMGSTKYKGGKGGKLPLQLTPFDLSNWKYVEGSFKNEKKFWHFIITLQCIEQDNGSLNWHVLMDRLGIMVDEIDEIEHLNAKEGSKIYSYTSHKLEDWKKSLTPFDLPILEINKDDFISELFDKKHCIQVYE